MQVSTGIVLWVTGPEEMGGLLITSKGTGWSSLMRGIEYCLAVLWCINSPVAPQSKVPFG